MKPNRPAGIQKGMDPRLANAFRTLPARRRRWRDMPKAGQMRWMLGLTGKVIRTACIVAIVIGVAATIYLTDRRSSDLETIPWLPWWLHDVAHWADYHGRFRNVPAYGMLSVPVLILFTSLRNRGRAVVALATFATVMEYTQLFIPTRYFDWYDIAESWLGILIVWTFVELAYLASRVAHRATKPTRTGYENANLRRSRSLKQSLPFPRPANE